MALAEEGELQKLLGLWGLCSNFFQVLTLPGNSSNSSPSPVPVPRACREVGVRKDPAIAFVPLAWEVSGSMEGQGGCWWVVASRAEEGFCT